MKTIAVAESLTGGGVGQAITQRAGASEYFKGGVIAYSNEVKRDLLHVSQELLDAHGAVSEEAAVAMAEGVRALCGTDIGLATTGVAGPDQIEGKEVGTVFIALVASGQHQVRALHLSGTREEIRAHTIAAALELLGI